MLKDHVGVRRRPLLALDAAESAAAGEHLGAHGAAIRGIANFASETVFGLKLLPSGELEPDWDAIDGFFARHGAEETLVFGFTFIVWTRFLLEAERRDKRFHAPHAMLLHSGGWKKLTVQAVTKGEFRRRVAETLTVDPRRILDFYGMVEQVGTVLVDCEVGNKHAPAFADVLIRRPCTLSPVEVGETGHHRSPQRAADQLSRPGAADRGPRRAGGRGRLPVRTQGELFRFPAASKQAEVRGCGDIFAQAREIR